jgi:hypothetical protein
MDGDAIVDVEEVGRRILRDKDELEMVVVAAWTKSGELRQYNSHVPVQEMIGLLESVKWYIIHHSMEELD